MNLKILISILLVNLGFLNGQKSGSVTYIIKPIIFEVDNNAKQKMVVNEIIKNAEKQKFVLKFNSYQSTFYHLEDLSNDELKEDPIYQMAAMRFTCDFSYFLDINRDKEFFKKNDGAIIENIYSQKNWKITTETKKIDNYPCFKALYEYEYLARDKKIKTRIITAWFAPSLPFSFGPKNYNGLPGLILELQDWDTTFLTTKIEISDIEIEINFPKGKTVTHEEYDKKILSRN